MKIKEISVDSGCIKFISECGNIKKSVIKSSVIDDGVIIITERMDNPGVYNTSIDKMSLEDFMKEFIKDDRLFACLLKVYL